MQPAWLSWYCLVLLLGVSSCSSREGAATGTDFRKTTLTDEFISEGVAVGDVNRDGLTDIIAGYFWFEAPAWKRHAISPGRIFDPTKEYSNSFLNYCMDVNLDGWIDLVLVDFPGKVALWFENPKQTDGSWKRHVVDDSVGIANESPAFVDIDGNGRVDLLCGDAKMKQIVWLSPPNDKDDTVWVRHVISAENVPGTDKYSHGLGFGDINNDGRKDIVITEGWWESPADPLQNNWRFHPASLGEPCSQMHVLDVNADGAPDVVSASAHKLGIWWYEGKAGTAGTPTFNRHVISETVSQTHASTLADLNGDSHPDLITGKRYLAHHASNDPGTHDPALLIWLEFQPDSAPYWKEHQIDNDSGAGLNIVAEDINKDGSTDVVIANKKGVFLLENVMGEKGKVK